MSTDQSESVLTSPVKSTQNKLIMVLFTLLSFLAFKCASIETIWIFSNAAWHPLIWISTLVLTVVMFQFLLGISICVSAGVLWVYKSWIN